jgi:hypothetical protein
MKHPTRSLTCTLQRVRDGVAAVGRRVRSVVAVVCEMLNSIRERHPTLATDLIVLVLQQLIVLLIERTIAWLVRRAAVRPTPARVVPFPTLRPAT